MANVDAAYAQLKDYWENKFAQLQIKTPNEGMNTLINTWNLYQAEVNIMFSRFASFIEVGGRTGLGYRDTAQDAMTIPHSNPGRNADSASWNCCADSQPKATDCICSRRNV